MKILIDTNVLISASRNDQGTPFKAFVKAATPPNRALVCDQNLDELRWVYNRKFPDKIHMMEKFLSLAIPVLRIIPMYDVMIDDETAIRDPKDRPTLRAAIIANIDILITGDKDFLESGLKRPKIMTPAEFLRQD